MGHENIERTNTACEQSCLDRFCTPCIEITNLETNQFVSLKSQSSLVTYCLSFAQHAIRCAHSQRCSTAFFLNLRVTASMIYSIPNLHRIHPHKVLNLVIPYHIKLLLANGTWLIGKSWVRWYRNVLIFGVSSSQRCSKCSSRGIRGGIYERSILGVVARFDPFLDDSVGEHVTIRKGVSYQLINVPATILTPLGRVGQALIGPKMPIQMASLLLFTFCCSEEPSTACRALIRSSFVQC